MDKAPRIQDYGIIGDCRSAALISNAGSIDWLCWPQFDSPSIFAALLDNKSGGYWSISPIGGYRLSRHYLPETNILITKFHTETGVWQLTDCMPVYEDEYQRSHLVPDREVLRKVECIAGEVRVRLSFTPRPNYARSKLRWKKHNALGLRVQFLGGVLWLRTEIDMELRDDSASAEIILKAGECKYFSLTFYSRDPAMLSPLGAYSEEALVQTQRWWECWSKLCNYNGPYRDSVLRSALVLKLLEFSPSGAIVAAPTTSLPECPGGDLNWDYRYCWLRDASLTVSALFGLGYKNEAEAFIEWLLHSTRLTHPGLYVMYNVYGKIAPKEQFLQHFSGYLHSRPVRIGNQAREQLQLDVYGEVIAASAQLDEADRELDIASARVLRSLGEYVCRHWDRPDAGIWEPRVKPMHHTHSRLSCWLALNELLQLHSDGLLNRIDVKRFEDIRESIRRDIEDNAWDPQLKSYTSALRGNEVDASLLMLAVQGFEPPASERMRATWACIQEKLQVNDVLLYRYRNNLSPGEGAFGVCCFWAVEYLAMGGGSLQQATERFEKLLSYANDLGLYGEEIDPQTGGALGNFPQGFTHIGLINAALALERRKHNN